MVDKGVNKIRLAYLISSAEIGGAEKMFLLLGQGLQRKGFAVRFFLIRGKGKFSKELRQAGLDTEVTDFRKGIREIYRFFKGMAAYKPDILHTVLFWGNIIGRVTGKILKLPVIICSQRSTDPWRRWYHWLLERWTANYCHAIVSNSYAGKKVLEKKGILRQERIYVIPNGLEVRQVKPWSREILGLKPEERAVVTVGNLRPAKGHSLLLLAAAEVSKQKPEVKFIIVGEGPLEKELKKKAVDLNIATRVQFMGFQEEPLAIVACCDIFVLPSLWEGCPVALLEAMALGKPCVATSVGDVPMIIKSGVDGLLVEPGKPGELARALLELLDDEKMRQNLGKQAYRKIKEFYSLEKMVDSYVKFYCSCLGLQEAEPQGKIIN